MTKKPIMSEWEKVLEFLQSDLEYLWKDAKPEFERMPSKRDRILFILKNLREHYKQNQEKYSKEISTLSELITLLEYNELDNLRSLMEGGLFSKTFTEAEKRFFQGLVIEKSKFHQEAVSPPLKMPLDLQQVKIGLRKIWVPTISGNLATTISASTANRLNSFFTYLSRNFGRVPKKIWIGSMLVPILIGAFPERGGGGYLRLRSDKEIIRQVLGKDFEDEKVQKMLEASEFGDTLAEVMNEYRSGDIKYENLPDYIKGLISDGVLDIAVLIGAEFEDYNLVKKDEIRLIKFAQNSILLRVRYIDSNEKLVEASESDVILVSNVHSRYGLGWALSKERMGNPLRMQPNPIRIPKKELHGYKGPVLKDLGKDVIVQASDEDIKRMKPKKGYQLIALTSCKTSQYFLEVFKRMRQGLPTTIIYTTQDVYASSDKTMVLLNGLLSGKGIEKITEELNSVEIRMSKKYKEPQVKNAYQAVVLNAEAGSPKSTAYDKHNIPNSLTLFYDIEV